MYLTPNSDKEIDRLLEKGKVVSFTRIEPPLHPDGAEKILLEKFGIEPEEFKEEELLKTWKIYRQEDGIKYALLLNHDRTNVYSAGIYKEDFQSIGGHDPLTPQSKEDSDIFNRFKLNGYEFIQT